MEPAYLYKLPSDTPIFRGKTVAKEGRWYALALDDAYTYGSLVTEYSTTKELRLLNIMSLTFHNDFMDRLMVLYPGKDYSGIDNDKMKCLIALGLFDIDIQRVSYCTVFQANPEWKDSTWNLSREWAVKMLHNRHRYSEHINDTVFVSVLERIYGEHYDGYIAPLCWATKMHGDFFPRELCLFKMGNVKEEREHVKPEPVVIGGMVPLLNSSTSKSSKSIDTEDNTFMEFPEDIGITRGMMRDLHRHFKEHPFQPTWNSHAESPIPPNSSLKPLSSNTIHVPSVSSHNGKKLGGKRMTRKKARHNVHID